MNKLKRWLAPSTHATWKCSWIKLQRIIILKIYILLLWIQIVVLTQIDLVGGYYDAGDNVKFGLPMAFTVTMLAWSVVEFGPQLGARHELSNALAAIKWGTDYLIKAHREPEVLYGEVGDGGSDHSCWQRPEDMTTPRTAYKIDDQHPGSDLAGETAAALAAAAVAFRHSNPRYSSELISHAKQVHLSSILLIIAVLNQCIYLKIILKLNTNLYWIIL